MQCRLFSPAHNFANKDQNETRIIDSLFIYLLIRFHQLPKTQLPDYSSIYVKRNIPTFDSESRA